MTAERVFVYRVAVLLTAAAIYVVGKAAGVREAERLFVEGFRLGHRQSDA